MQTLKLQIGKYYRTRDGKVIGPMRFSAPYWMAADGSRYDENGKRYQHHSDALDLVAEQINS